MKVGGLCSQGKWFSTSVIRTIEMWNLITCHGLKIQVVFSSGWTILIEAVRKMTNTRQLPVYNYSKKLIADDERDTFMVNFELGCLSASETYRSSKNACTCTF